MISLLVLTLFSSVQVKGVSAMTVKTSEDGVDHGHAQAAMTQAGAHEGGVAHGQSSFSSRSFIVTHVKAMMTTPRTRLMAAP